MLIFEQIIQNMLSIQNKTVMISDGRFHNGCFFIFSDSFYQVGYRPSDAAMYKAPHRQERSAEYR